MPPAASSQHWATPGVVLYLPLIVVVTSSGIVCAIASHIAWHHIGTR